MNLPSLDSVNWTLGILGITGILIGGWRSKARQRLSAGLDALIGREEVTDRSGKVITPAQPGAMHRLETMEAAVTTLAEVITDQHEMRAEVSTLNREVSTLNRRVGVLEDARAERLVTQVESAHMWRAVADRDVIDDEGDK